MLTRVPSLAPVGILAIALTTPLAAQTASAARVTVSGGPHAGSYAVESVATCEISPPAGGGPDQFSVAVQSRDNVLGRMSDKPRALALVQMSVPNIQPAHLHELEITITFGDPENRRQRGAFYQINTMPISAVDSLFALETGQKTVDRKSLGRGGATIDRRGGQATVKFWGDTGAGVRFDGTIDCRRVTKV